MSSGNQRIVRDLLALCAAALVRWIGGQSTTKPGSPLPSQKPARLRSRKSSISSIEMDEASPGQFGDGATRDLTKAELSELRPIYSPQTDGEPDPGEVVWTWVPYVELDGRGKDRPVLIIARLNASAWAGCYLSTKEHRGFVSVGRGAWDSQGRESYLSPERVLRVSADGMRREAAAVDKTSFEKAVAAVKRYHSIG